MDNHVLAFKAVVLLFDMQLECQNRQQLWNNHLRNLKHQSFFDIHRLDIWYFDFTLFVVQWNIKW